MAINPVCSQQCQCLKAFDYGIDMTRPRTEGVKNTRRRFGYHQKRQTHIATYNIRKLSPHAKLLQLEELQQIE